MTLSRDMLKQCQDAIPALGMLHQDISTKNAAWAKMCADALWHWPELIDAATKYYESMQAMAEPKYHSAEVKLP